MPNFDTPKPISVTLDLWIADVLISAGDRAGTVVEVTPSSEAKPNDVWAAEQTRVEYADGVLLVKSPRVANRIGLGARKDASVDVRIELPSGSRLRADSGMGAFRCVGRLGECEIKSGAGSISVEYAEAARLRTGGGDVTADTVAGRAEASTGVGEVRVGNVGGPLVIKNSAGAIRVGTAADEARLSTASGDIALDRAGGSVHAKTAAGKIRVGEVRQGTVVLESSAGGLEVGIRAGTAAWLDAHSTAGSVRNLLDTADQPGQTDQTVEVRARTHIGDIVVRRVTPAATE